MSADREQLTAEVKAEARRWGAALVGVASVDRFDPLPPLRDRVPEGHHPRDYLPEARSVISIAQPVLDPVIDAPARLATRDLPMIPGHVRYPYFETLYHTVGHALQDRMLEFAGQMVGQWLVARGYTAMIFPTTGLHPHIEGMSDVEIWENHTPFRYTFGPFSHRHAATRAGLGEFGYNNLVLTREFGPRQRFNSIITDAELEPDPLISEPICLRDRCRLCMKACIVQCITLRTDARVRDYRSVDRDDPERIFIDTPARTDPTLCRRRRDGIPDSPVRGDCVRVCPIPTRRRNLPQRLETLVSEWEAHSNR